MEMMETEFRRKEQEPAIITLLQPHKEDLIDKYVTIDPYLGSPRDFVFRERSIASGENKNNRMHPVVAALIDYELQTGQRIR